MPTLCLHGVNPPALRGFPHTTRPAPTADIPVEKKSGGGGWWKWLLGLLLLGLIIWAIAEALDTDEEEVTEVDPVVTEEVTPEPVETTSAISLAAILDNPQEYMDQDFVDLRGRTDVQVGSELTDRGFWIMEGGDSLFAVIVDEPQEEPLDINPNQELEIEEAMLREPSVLPGLPGDPLDQDTQNIAEQQEIFMVVNETDITIVEPGNPQ